VSPAARAGEFPRIEVHADPASLPSIHLAPGEAESGVEVLHEDGLLTVLDKPSGVPVVPDRARAFPSCLGFLVRRELESRPGKPPALYARPRVVHRIDRLTSGVVVLARTLEAEVDLSAMFEAGVVRKEYLALVSGRVVPSRVAVSYPIGPGRKGKMRADPAGKPSFTEFEALERFREFTLVRARPRTGRTHQIRVHAWAMGHPLAVDPLYRVGAPASLPPPPGIRRLTLHASRIELPPRWPGRREFQADLPADFRAALEALRAGVPAGPAREV
jgi:RluA family pseudouridine synthase